MLTSVHRLAAAATVAFAATGCGAIAQDYPERPIVINVGVSPGGSSDISARAFARFLEEEIPGSSVVVENRPGADGANMYRYVAQAEPDGYTLALIISPTAFSKLHEGTELGYGIDSFDYIGQLMADYTVLPVAVDSEFQTLEDMIEFARENPGDLAIGVTGFSGPYIAVNQLFDQAGVDVTWVPYGSGGEIRAALLGGVIHSAAINLPSTISYSDTLRPVVVFAPERLELLPDTPTAVESGYDVVAEVNRGIIAPAGLPEDIHSTLETAVRNIVNDPEYQEELAEVFVSPDHLGSEEYEAEAEAIYEEYGRIWEEDPWIQR